MVERLGMGDFLGTSRLTVPVGAGSFWRVGLVVVALPSLLASPGSSAEELAPEAARDVAESRNGPSSGAAEGIPAALAAEFKRWADDSVALVKAPISWDGRDWTRFGAGTAATAGLMVGDKQAFEMAVRNQSASRDSAARFVVRFGGEYALGASALLLGGGLVFGDRGTRDMGRDAIEASLLTGLLSNVVFKPLLGRERPTQSQGETVFHPLSSYASLPSGHTTEAFAVASVISMRSDGWVVPTVAYTVASLVGVARVYQQAHFPSDVCAGALLGTFVGRFVVSRHTPRPAVEGKASLSVVAIPGGLAIHVSR